MKKSALILTLLWCAIAFAQNPFEDYGYEPKIGTLSQGEYIEHFDTDSIVRIGSVMFNTYTNTITQFVIEETRFTEAGAEPTVMSRWWGSDPLAAQFPEWSPYNFVKNSPNMYTDPTGAAPETIYKKIGTDETVEVEDGVDKTIEVSDSDFEIAELFAFLINTVAEMGDGTLSINLGPTEEVAEAYGEFYSSVNSYDGASLSNVVDYVFNGPKINVWHKTKGSSGAFEWIGGGGRKVGQLAFKAFTRANYRHNLKALTGRLGIGQDAHHEFPQLFGDFFKGKNINIHHPEYMKWWGSSAHRSAAKAVNKEWAEWIATKGVNAKRADVIKFGESISKKYGL